MTISKVATPSQDKQRKCNELQDSRVPGLKLRSRGTSQTWCLVKKINGRFIRYTIGRYPEVSRYTARQKALALLGEIAMGHFKTKNERKPCNLSLSEVFEGYLKLKGDKLAPSTITSYRNDFKHTFSSWSKRPISEITSEIALDLHRKRSSTSKARADGAMRLLRALFNYANGSSDNNNTLSDPTQKLNRYRLWNNVPRKRSSIPLDMAHKFVKGLEADANRTSADATLLLLFTGCRLNEILKLRWSDVDITNMTIRITENKSKRPVCIPLNQYAAQVIESRYLSRAQSDYVFSYNNTHLKSIRKCLARHAPELSAHDLRRTFITTGDNVGVGHYMLKLLANHMLSKSDVTAGYISSDLVQMREASNRIASKLLAH